MFNNSWLFLLRLFPGKNVGESRQDVHGREENFPTIDLSLHKDTLSSPYT